MIGFKGREKVDEYAERCSAELRKAKRKAAILGSIPILLFIAFLLIKSVFINIIILAIICFVVGVLFPIIFYFASLYFSKKCLEEIENENKRDEEKEEIRGT